MTRKKNIALICGGFTGEAGVSRNGARVVEKHIDKSLYNVYKIFIYRNKWYFRYENSPQSATRSQQKMKKGKNPIIEIPVDKNDFSIVIKGKKVRFDCVFNVIHGGPGEDGKLQGYFDLLGIPYINSNQTASAITFNKYITGLVAGALGIKVPKSMLIRSQQPGFSIKQKTEEIIKELGLPVIVKPNNGGSSIGMSKVDKVKELGKAIIKAFKEDDEVILQEFIKGTEITCGMIKKGGKVLALPLTEVVTTNSFFDYEAKYKKGKSKEITPARVSNEVEQECKCLSKMFYEEMNCKGMVRMDYIVRSQQSAISNKKKNNIFQMYLLDVNTVPGLSEASIVPQQAASAGITLKELYDIVINEALKAKTGK